MRINGDKVYVLEINNNPGIDLIQDRESLYQPRWRD